MREMSWCSIHRNHVETTCIKESYNYALTCINALVSNDDSLVSAKEETSYFHLKHLLPGKTRGPSKLTCSVSCYCSHSVIRWQARLNVAENVIITNTVSNPLQIVIAWKLKLEFLRESCMNVFKCLELNASRCLQSVLWTRFYRLN